MTDTKRCNKCKQDLPKDSFKKNKSRPDGLYPSCRTCDSAYWRNYWATNDVQREKRRAEHREWKKKNPNYMRDWMRKARELDPEKYRLVFRKANLKRQYKITIADYDALYDKQDGKCAICEERHERAGLSSQRTGILVIDHCHKKGDVRELLCANCNAGIGMFGDDVRRLERAVLYLKRHTV